MQSSLYIKQLQNIVITNCTPTVMYIPQHAGSFIHMHYGQPDGHKMD